MEKVFIIGNGFDKSHGMKTSYEDFKKYLEENEDIDTSCAYVHPESTLMPDGDFNFPKSSQFVYNLLSGVESNVNNFWNDIENSCGKFDYSQFMDWFISDEIDEDHPFREIYKAEDASSDIYSVVLTIKKLFEEWVNQLDIADEQLYPEIVKSESTFINFNYTHTLEDLYGIRNVLHIHGSNRNSEVIFGHGEVKEIKTKLGAEYNINDLHKALYKPVKDIIRKNIDWFESLGSIKTVYVLGHSLNNIDFPYFSKIKESILPGAKWLVSYYNKNEVEKMKKQLDKLDVDYTLINGIQEAINTI